MTAKLHGSVNGVARLLTALGFSGDLSVSDALAPGNSRAFLEQTEAVSPLSLPGAEEFLYADLVSYAANPDAAEQRLVRDMDPSAGADIRALLLKAGLADVRTALSPVAAVLRQDHLWPMPLLRVDSVEEEGGQWTAEITVFGRQ